jgi:predicted dehydrogenase
MPLKNRVVNRRRFLVTAAKASAVLAAPLVVPGRVLGKDGAVAPSERITLGAIGTGGRGEYVLKFMLDLPDVQCLAVCDVRAERRQAIKKLVDAKYGNKDGAKGCATYRDLREVLGRSDIDAVLIATGDRWHAIAAILAAKAGKDIYCEKPCAMTMALDGAVADVVRRYGRIFQAGTQRRNVGNFVAAVDMARSGKLGKLQAVHASIYTLAEKHNWLPAEPEPAKEVVDWDLWLGPAPWRPYNHRYLPGGWSGYFDFDAGAGLLGWGSHTVDLCQWAAGADGTTPIEFEAQGNSVVNARYANGVKLVMRNSDWIGLGSCPVRFEGTDGWVETADSGKMVVYPNSLRTAEMVCNERGISPKHHVREFFNCVRTRAVPAANADIMRKSHVACHAAYIAWAVGRKVKFDPVKEEFIGDDEANRMRSRAIREPWRI